MADVAARAQILETGDRLSNRVRTCPVQQVQIDAVEPEPLAAAIAGGGNAGAAGVVRVDLADDVQLFTFERASAQRFAQRLPDNLLGAAFAVHLGGVDQSITQLEREPHGSDFFTLAAPRFAHAPSAEAERRKMSRSIRQGDGTHRTSMPNRLSLA